MGLFSGVRSYFNKSTDYLKQAKINQEDAVNAAANTITSGYNTAQDTITVGGQILLGTVAYDCLSGKIMTAYSVNSLGVATGMVAKNSLATKAVNMAAAFLFKHPAIALAGTIGAVFFVAPEKAIKMCIDAGKTVYHAAETATDVTKCAFNVTTGLILASMEATDYATDYFLGNNQSSYESAGSNAKIIGALGDNNDFCII